MSLTVSVKVWGEFALFTRPELKVERVSYPMMTPSAARGVLDAILYKPQMRWHVRRITALKPVFPRGFPAQSAEAHYRFIQIRRNEVQDAISPNTVSGWIKNPKTFAPYLVDSAGRDDVQGAHRTQRNSLILHHVAYRIDASPKLTAKANKQRAKPEDNEDHGQDTEVKYAAMFNRRVEKGQCFHRPYLGCREFACQFAPLSDSDQALREWTEPLGLMLYDIRFGLDGKNYPGFFMAKVTNGVLHCDTEDHGRENPSRIQVLGWNTEGGSK